MIALKKTAETHWAHDLALHALVVHAIRGGLPEETEHLKQQGVFFYQRVLVR